jgi:hypothetical protein
MISENKAFRRKRAGCQSEYFSAPQGQWNSILTASGGSIANEDL